MCADGKWQASFLIDSISFTYTGMSMPKTSAPSLLSAVASVSARAFQPSLSEMKMTVRLDSPDGEATCTSPNRP